MATTLPPLPPTERPNRWNLGLPFGGCAAPGCIIRTNLSKCGGCHAILYCGQAHQKVHRSTHKLFCNIVKKALSDLSREEGALRPHAGDAETPPRPFENAQPQFWFWYGTRPYMQARYDLLTALLNIRSGEAVEAALGHCLGMLDLNRGDNQGVRGQVPALYMRLGRDQAAYDFLKWYAVEGATSTYDWRDESLPYLDLRDEDAFEPCDCHARNYVDLSFLASVTCLKVRLLLDIRTLSRHVAERGGPSKATFDEKMEWIREDAVSDVLHGRRDVVDQVTDYKDLAADLEAQVDTLYGVVEDHNRHYWPALRRPEQYGTAQPTIYSAGSREEVVLAFRHTWYMWAECPDVLTYILQLGKKWERIIRTFFS